LRTSSIAIRSAPVTFATKICETGMPGIRRC
jgi:hypothetical protein